MLSLYPLPLADRNLVVGQNPWKKSNVDRVICRDQTHKKVELVLAENGNSSIFFQGNPVEHNFPKKIRNIEKAKIFLQNVWVQSIVNSAGETRISFNPTLLGGGVLDNLPPKKLQEIKDRCQRSLKDPTTDILGELLAEDLIEFSDMEAYSDALTKLYSSARQPDDRKIDGDGGDGGDGGPMVDEEDDNKRNQKYAVAIIEQDVVQHLPPKLQPMAQKKLQQKMSQDLVVRANPNQKSHTALSTALERVEENSYYIQAANQQHKSSGVVLHQFASQVADLRELQGHRLIQSEGLTRAFIDNLKVQSRLRNDLVEGQEMSLLEKSNLLVTFAENDSKIASVQFEAMRNASEQQAKVLTANADAMARLNQVVLQQYEKTAITVLERTCSQVSTLRKAELDAFMAEQSGRQNIKEEEYRIDLAKRAKVDGLNREEKEFFLQMKEKESDIVLSEKMKASEIDLTHQLKMNKHEQQRMEQEIAYLKEKDGDIDQRNLMTAFKDQLKVYEENVKQCRLEIQACGGKKNYRLNLSPPEIKTGPKGERYVQPGKASYHIHN